jgi:hypothetical protein
MWPWIIKTGKQSKIKVQIVGCHHCKSPPVSKLKHNEVAKVGDSSISRMQKMNYDKSKQLRAKD